MTPHDQDHGGRQPRRGLLAPHLRAGTATVLALRAIRAVRGLALATLEVIVAIIILFEEWGWRPLAAALAHLARIRLVARIEAGVAALPPWPALAVFLVPWLLFLPLKLVSFWLIAKGQVVAATLIFALAKVAGTALYARIFQLTQPALMRLAWFARAYNWFMPWKERIIAHAKETAVWKAAKAAGARAKALARGVWARLRPAAIVALQKLKAAFGR
jgi:hypothetical protein